MPYSHHIQSHVPSAWQHLTAKALVALAEASKLHLKDVFVTFPGGSPQESHGEARGSSAVAWFQAARVP